MKQISLLLICCLSIAISVAANPFYATKTINIRAGAGSKYKILGTLNKGDSINVSEFSGPWGKINYQNRKGFVNSKFLTLASPATSNNLQNNWSYNHPFISVLIGVIVVIFILGIAWRILLATFNFFLSLLGLKRKKNITSNYTLIGGRKIPNEKLPKTYKTIVDRISKLESLKSKNIAIQKEIRDLKDGLGDLITGTK